MKKGLWKRRAFAFLVAVAMVIPQGVYAAETGENEASENAITEEVLERVHEEGCILAPDHEGNCVTTPTDNTEETQLEKEHEAGCTLTSNHEGECEVEEKTEEIAMLKAPQDARAGGTQDIGEGDITISGNSCGCSESNPHIITGTAKYHFPNGVSFITVSSGNHYVKLNDVEVKQEARTVPAMKIEDNANVTLILEGNNNLHGGNYNAGLYVSENAHLTIKGSGTLNAYGGGAAAGIGGSNENAHCGHITIEDGYIRVEGGTSILGRGAAGIGSGYVENGNCSGSVTINGGNVIAISGSDSAGIGGGENVGGCDVTINGGIVYAQGDASPSIGGGYKLIGEVDNGDFSTGTDGHAVIIAPQGIGNPRGADKWDGIFINRGDANSAETDGDTIQLNADAVVIGSPDMGDVTISKGTTLTIFGGQKVGQKVGQNLGGHIATVDIDPAKFTVGDGDTLTNNGKIINDGHLILRGNDAGTGSLVNNHIVSVLLKKDMITFKPKSPQVYDGSEQNASAVVTRQIWNQNPVFQERVNYEVTKPAETMKDAGNYIFTVTPTADQNTSYRLLDEGVGVGQNFEIEKRPISVSVPWSRNISSKESDFLNALPKGTLNGVIAGDNVTVSLSWKDKNGTLVDASTPVPAAGNYEYIWTATLDGADKDNYILDPVSGTTAITVTDDEVTDIVIDGAGILDGKLELTYGDPLMENPLTLTVSLKGKAVTIPVDKIHWSIDEKSCFVQDEHVAKIQNNGELTISNAGEATIQVTVDRFEDNGTTYAGGTGRVDLTVLQVHLNASLKNPFRELVYTGSKDVVLSESDYTITGYKMNDDTEKEVSVSATGTLDSANAGKNKTLTTKYVVSGKKAGNYIAPVDESTTITVQKADSSALSAKATADLFIDNNTARTYPFYLRTLLDQLNADGVVLGTVTYSNPVIAENSNNVIVSPVNLNNNMLSVKTNAVDKLGEVAKITVTITSTNYEDFKGTITVTATDKPITQYTITASAGANGSITPDGTVYVNEGNDKTFMITPDSGYVISDVKVDGVSQGAVNRYTFMDVKKNHTISATFERSSDGGSSSGGGHTSNTYYVRYHNDDETEKDGKFIPGETVTVKGNVFTAPVGKVLAGWSLEEDGKVDYKVGDTFRMPGSSVDLYAVWKDAETESHSAYISGYPDGTVGPDKTITRAEAATMFYNLLTDKTGDAKAFTDVPANQWYAKAVMTLAGKGVISGYPDGTFKPDASITRAEFVTMAMNFANAEKGTACSFPDVPQNMWYYGAIAGATQNGWISGYPDGTFGPDRYITRAEVTSVINRMENRAADMSFMMDHLDELRTFSDLGFGHWAYGSMMEAANGHDYTRADQNSYESWVDIH